LIQTAKAINNGAITYIGDPTHQQHGIQAGVRGWGAIRGTL
jgi:hypothetical protein